MPENNQANIVISLAEIQYNDLLDRLKIPKDERIDFEETFKDQISQVFWSSWLQNEDAENNSLLMAHLYNIYRAYGKPSSVIFKKSCDGILKYQIDTEESHKNVLAVWRQKNLYLVYGRLLRHVHEKLGIEYGQNFITTDKAKIEEVGLNEGAVYEDLRVLNQFMPYLHLELSAEELLKHGREFFECNTTTARASKEGSAEMARSFFEKAAKLGSSEADYYLGLIYMHGLGYHTGSIKEDEKVGRAHLKTAVEKGNIRAKFYLAALDIITEHEEKALNYFIELSQESFPNDLNSNAAILQHDNEVYEIAIAKLFYAQNLLDQYRDKDKYLQKAYCLASEVLSCSTRLAKLTAPMRLSYSKDNLNPNWDVMADWNVIAVFANTCIKDINHLLEVKQKEAEKTLLKERILSIYSHQFGGALQEIINQLRYGDDIEHALKAARSMAGLLEVIQVISAKPERLRQQWHNDVSPDTDVADVLNGVIHTVLLDLLSPKRFESMAIVYYALAIKDNGIPSNINLIESIKKTQWRSILRNYQIKLEKEWENMLGCATKELIRWIGSNICEFRISGFEECRTKFSLYGTKASVLTIILSEVVKNAIIHSKLAIRSQIKLDWEDSSGEMRIICSNPNYSEPDKLISSTSAGQGREFLTIITEKIGGDISFSSNDDIFIVKVELPLNYQRVES